MRKHIQHSALPVQTLDDESFSRVLSLQFLHHIVQLTVQLQHKHYTFKHFTSPVWRVSELKRSVTSYHAHFLIEDISQVGYVLEHSHIATYTATETKTALSLSFSSSTWTSCSVQLFFLHCTFWEIAICTSVYFTGLECTFTHLSPKFVCFYPKLKVKNNIKRVLLVGSVGPDWWPRV